jgi:hypothetical protein
MSWRPASLVTLVALLAFACGGGKAMKVKKGEPQTAREKMLAEEGARKRGDDTEEEEVTPPGSKQWTGWRYQGDRKECFFIVGKKCFKTEKAACAAASCKEPSKCETEGAGPAQVSCSKVAGDEPAAEPTKADEKPDEAPEKKPAKKSRKKKG